MRCSCSMHNVTRYLFPYYETENPELYSWNIHYIWNQTGNNNNIISYNTPSWPHQHLRCMSLRKSLFWLLMPQSHPTKGPVQFLSPVRFLAHKAEWSGHRNFMSVLFSWSHQATGPVWLDMAVYLWFGWIIHRTSWVLRAVPVLPSYGPRTGIFKFFYILRDPHGPVCDPQGCCTGCSTGPVRWGKIRTAPHGTH